MATISTSLDHTNIEDTFINGVSDSTNWGGFGDVFFGNADTYRPLIRINNLPVGNYTQFDLNFYTTSAGRVLEAFIITNANNWVEGTGTGSAQTGSASWTHTQYSTVTWAGSDGCGTSGTDFDADASPPQITTVSGTNTWSLPVAWPTAWSQGTRTNNGLIIFDTSGAGSHSFESTEAASNQPSVDITYSELGRADFIFNAAIVRRRRGNGVR